MEALVTYLAKALVDKPDQVEVRTSDSEGVRLLELKVAPEDVGKVIGRDGRTVNAMRTLLALAAQKQGMKARLEILDDRKGQPQPAAASPDPAQTPPTQS